MSLAFWFRMLPAVASGPSSNRVLNYQLRLTDASGIPLTGTKNVKISFYTAASGGSPIHTDCGTTGTPVARKVIFTNGIGSVLIGDTSASGSENCADASAPNALASTLFNSTSLYLGVTVESDAEMTPRKRVTSGGFAANADFLDDLDTSAAGGSVAFVPVTDSSGNLTLTKNLTVDGTTMFVDSTNDRVGVGTTTPAQRMQVRGSIVTDGDQYIDGNGTVGAMGTRTAIADGATLVSAAGQGLCTNSLAYPETVYKDGNGDCTSGNGGTDVALFTGGGESVATVTVTSAWAFNDADTDCNGDGTGGDASCTASDGIYQAGQDLYVDRTPSLQYHSGNIAIGSTSSANALLSVTGTGDGDYADFTSLVNIESVNTREWALSFTNANAGRDKVIGMYVGEPSPDFDQSGTLFITSYDGPNYTVDSIMKFVPGSGNVGIGSYSYAPTKLTVTAEPDYTNVGGTTTANAATSITGVGTKFVTYIAVGDRISLSSAPTVYATVTGISSDTSLTVDRAIGNGTSQTINRKQGILRLETSSQYKAFMNDLGDLVIGGFGTLTQPRARFDLFGNARFTGKATAVLSGSIDPAASTTVTGVNTNFTRELVVGDRITVTGETRTVTAIASDTSLTVDTAFSNNANDTSPDVLYAMATFRDSANALKLSINDAGSLDAVAHSAFGGSASVSSNTVLNVQETMTQASGFATGLSTNVTANPSSSPATTVVQGLFAGVDTVGAGATNFDSSLSRVVAAEFSASVDHAGNTPTVFAIDAYTLHNSASNTTDEFGIYSDSEHGGSGTITNLYGFYNEMFLLSTGNVTNRYGLRIKDIADSGAGSVTNDYGIYLDAHTAGATSFAIYSAGGTNYFGGNVGVGTSTKLSRLTVVPAADVTNIGGTTTANASTTITGVGTTFTTSLGIGDRISLSSAASTYATVTAIASDTSLTVSAALGNGTSQTINKKQSIFRLDDASGANVLTVNDAGRVGIGTASPSSSLSVLNNNGFGGASISVGPFTGQTGQSSLHLTANTATQSLISFGSSGTTVKSSIFLDTDNSLKVCMNSAGNCIFATDTKLTIDSTGKVGIGQVSPTAFLTLHPSTDNAQTLKLEQQNSTDGWEMHVSNSAGMFRMNRIGSSAGERLTIANTGEVGIGDTSPGSGFGGSGTTGQLSVVRTSSGATMTGLNLINAASATNTAIALDFTPNINVTLARINATRTNTGGAGTTDLVFSNYRGATTTLTDNMRIAGDTGYVGIGTASPGSTLHLQQSGGSKLRFNGTSNTTFDNSVSTDTNSFVMNYTTIGSHQFVMNNDSVGGTSDGFSVQTGSLSGAMRFRIDSDTGFVGVGTSTPTQRFTVADGGNVQLDAGLFNTPSGGFGRFENYLLQSEEIGVTSWTNESTIAVTANTDASPDGSTTADKVTTGGAAAANGVTQAVSMSSTTATWTGSVWMKMTTGTATVNLRISDDNQTGTASAKSVTTSWQRFSVTEAALTLSTAVTFRIETGTATNVLLWGAQLEKQANAGVYAKTKTVGVTSTQRGFVANSSGSHYIADGNLSIASAPEPEYRISTGAGITGAFFGTTTSSTVGAPQIDLIDTATSQETVLSSQDGAGTTGTFLASWSNHPLMFGTNASSTSGTKMTLSAAGDLTLPGNGAFTLGSKASDPTGANGMTYYNTTSNKFRCYENGSWKDCDTGGGAGMSIGGTVTSGTAGSVLFVNSGPVLAQDNANFFFDDTNNRLGLGDATPAATLTVGSGDVFQVDSSGNVDTNAHAAFGATASTNANTLINVSETFSGTTTGKTGLSMIVTTNPSGNSSGYHDGIYTDVTTSGAGAVNFTGTLSGIESNAVLSHSGTTSTGYAVNGEIFHGGTGAVSTMAGVYGAASSSGSGAVTDLAGMYSNIYIQGMTGTNAYGLRLYQSGTPTSLTNNYGLYIDPVAGGTNAYSIYSNGGQSYFAGNVGIGTNAPDGKLTVISSTSSATSADAWGARIGTVYGIADTGLKQGLQVAAYANHTSGTLANMYGLIGLASGAGNGGTTTNAVANFGRVDSATGHTVTNAVGFSAADGTGAGSITNQIGLYVASLTKGSSTNYAIFTDGSTSSYFGGNIGITDLTPDAKLDVTSGAAGTDGIFVDNTSSGDPVVQFRLSDTAKYTMGIDNSTTNDDFVLSTGGTLGTNNKMSIDGSSGDITFTGSTLTMALSNQLYLSTGNLTLNQGNITLSNSYTVDWGAAGAGNYFYWKIPRRSGSNVCSPGGATEGINIKDDGGTQVGHICIDGPTGGNKLRYYAEAFNATSTDLAEMYSTKPEEALEAGDVVELDPAGGLLVRKTTSTSAKALGIISTSPGLALTGIDEATAQSDTTNGKFVALKGRVPVKVTMENGTISVGDWLMASSTPGMAMKATEAGVVIGRALDAASANGTIRLFVEVGWWNGGDIAPNALGAALPGLTVMTEGIDMSGNSITNVATISGLNGIWTIDGDGRLTAKEVVADLVKTKSVSVTKTDDSKTIGESVLASGQSAVQVHDAALLPASKVFFSMRKNPMAYVWVDEVGEGFFVLKSDKPMVEDVGFDYWIIGVEDRTTPPQPPAAPAPAPVDTDGDGLTDEREAALGTNPEAADTDLDGFTDGEEVATGHDPLAAAPPEQAPTEPPAAPPEPSQEPTDPPPAPEAPPAP